MESISVNKEYDILHSNVVGGNDDDSESDNK